jgi:hypothetical protein
LNLTYADDSIAITDSKYTYGFWRAVTAIQEDADPNWLPLITTPAHPSYPCAHCVFSTSAAEVLASFFGTDNIRFSSTSEGTGVTRSYTSLTQAGDEGGLSRLYGGIHWRFDINAGNGMGRALARYVTANFLLPLSDAPGPRAAQPTATPADPAEALAADRVPGEAGRTLPPAVAAEPPASAAARPTRAETDVDRFFAARAREEDKPVVSWAHQPHAGTALPGGWADLVQTDGGLWGERLSALPGV